MEQKSVESDTVECFCEVLATANHAIWGGDIVNSTFARNKRASDEYKTILPKFQSIANDNKLYFLSYAYKLY